jgi:hypothetical protein
MQTTSPKAVATFTAAFIAAVSLLAFMTASGEGPLLRAPGGEQMPPPPGPVESSPAAHRFRFVGSASCSASNCHGGDGSRTVQGTGDPLSPQAYSMWAQQDPHARAFRVLYDKKSQQIAERLGLENAFTAKACLECHAINAGKAALAATARHSLHDGVGCEACHGAAEAWLDQHKWPTWPQVSQQQRQSLGYRDLRNLTERARMCAECHVGSRNKDVNHDLIAAGHPRMAFELSAYHSNLPKHWKREPVPSDQLDAKLWLLGQVVSAESSAELLAQRAANSRAPWPEFSEYDCFACHHDLADPSWRQKEQNSPPRPLGIARWGSWHFQLVSLVEQATGEKGDALEELRQEMERTTPRREEAKRLAEQVRSRLGSSVAAITRRPIGPADRLKWISRLTDDEQTESLGNWDAAAQRYLACAAMNYSNSSSRSGEPPSLQAVDAALRRIRELLQFPGGPGVQGYSSPKNESEDVRQAVREAFSSIHQAIRFVLRE